MAERIDDLIRQRLLVDGEGCLEDKKITTLTKQMIDWIEDPMKAGLEHDLDKTLGQLELQGIRNMLVYNMLATEQNTLENLKLEEKIKSCQKKVHEQEHRLTEAKQHRKYEEEADALSSIVERNPTQEETNSNIGSLKEDFVRLEKEEDNSNKRFDKRKREFFSLVASAHQLNTMVKRKNIDDMDTN